MEQTPALQYPRTLPGIEHCTDVLANMPSESQQAASAASGVHCLPGSNLHSEQNLLLDYIFDSE